jgi:thiol-disulfide isomerase/thioredoxin
MLLTVGPANVGKVSDFISNGNALVFIHAPWCPYTVAFYKAWKKIKKTLLNTSEVNVIEIDDKAITQIRTQFPNVFRKLAGKELKLYFPTVLLFVNGKRYKYEDEREVDKVVQFVEKYTKPNTKPRTSTRTSMTPRKIVSFQNEVDKAFKRLFH